MTEERTGVKKWLPLAVLALTLFIIVLDSTIINVSIKAIIGDLHTDLKAVQWVITGYSLMLAAFTITGGRLGDIFGRKRMFMIGAVIFAVGSLLASRVQSAPALLLCVVGIEGVGAAIMLPSTASLILSEYRGKDRALAFGVYGAVAGAAATIGPVVGGYLTTNYSWRWNYLINPFVVLVLLGGSVVLREAQERQHEVPDILSIFLSAFGLASVVFGIIESSTYGWIKAKLPYEIASHHYSLHGVSISVFAIILGLVLVSLFIWRQSSLESRGKNPLVSLSIFKNKQFMAGTTTLMVAVLSQVGLVFVLPVFFQGLLGKDAFHSGIAILPFSLAILVAAPLSGILAGKCNVPNRWLVQVGLVCATIGGLLLHSELTVQSTVHTLVPGLAVFGVGFGLAFSQLANITLSAVSVQEAGEAAGVNNTFRQIGASLGQALIGALLIATLVSQLNRDASASSVIPPQFKTTVATATASSAESLGTVGGEAPGSVSQNMAAEITRIKNDSIVHGARIGMLAATGSAVLALGLSTLLPKRAAVRGEDIDPHQGDK
ncbi:MAG TPA: DHA2 family efflux MFS transporter permease subunit [Patescibacteria group bacterium]|nr:DHA2 family efflux MFS transporter permease subunit [Patescibacteria group bacterium]